MGGWGLKVVPVSPWIPQAANGEVVTRFADVVANGANHAGHALTNFLRFLILLPAIVTLLIAEGCVRLDQQLVKKLGGEL
jgi:hypothetical protein